MDKLLAGDKDPAERLDGPGQQERQVTDADRLAAERTALRRVAMLVAGGSEASEVFDTATEALGRCIPGAKAGLWRFDPSGEITTVAAAAGPAKLMTWPVGSRQPVAGSHLVAKVQDTGRPVRVDSYDTVSASVAARVGREGIFSAVAVPVVVDGGVWGMAAAGSVRPCPMPADTEAQIAGFTELIATAVMSRNRDERERQLETASSRPALMDALLEGRICAPWGLWEAASRLLLPSRGPFVVLAADVPTVGEVALPGIEPKLRSLDVYSAWRMLPDLQVGILYVKSDRQLDAILGLLTRMATHRVGVSNRFDDLRDVPPAFHVAKVTLRSRARSGSLVAVFDGSILGTAAVCAPEVMVKSVGTVLNAFDDLGEEERELLFETFRVWQESDASVRATAEVLICHPNTVRYRLRRIEQRTGRSLSRPRDIAELCLAFEVQRRLM